MDLNPALITPCFPRVAWRIRAAGSTATWPFDPTIRAVLVWCTTDAYIAIGDSVTATTNDLPLPAYTPVVLPIVANVPGSSSWRVSAIQIAAGGTVYAKPLMQQ